MSFSTDPYVGKMIPIFYPISSKFLFPIRRSLDLFHKVQNAYQCRSHASYHHYNVGKARLKPFGSVSVFDIAVIEKKPQHRHPSTRHARREPAPRDRQRRHDRPDPNDPSPATSVSRRRLVHVEEGKLLDVTRHMTCP